MISFVDNSRQGYELVNSKHDREDGHTEMRLRGIQ